MSGREEYALLCEREPSIPLFSQAWWLTAVCGSENWDVALFRKGGQVCGALPYAITRRFGFTVLSQPPLTQTLGPWIKPLSTGYASRLGEQKDILHALIDALPPYDQYAQNWHYSITNWLPFYWRGFQQSTRYTYAIDELNSEAQLWSGLQEGIRRNIRKAQKRFKLVVHDDSGIETVLRLSQLSFQRQGMGFSYDEALLRRIDAACHQRQCRRAWIASDQEGRPHAGIYVVWDRNSAYYLLGGGDPSLRNSGAASLCLWHAIGEASNVTQCFDFEGSMLEPIERFFRGFGATQKAYFHVWRTPSFALRMRGLLKKARARSAAET